MAFHSFSEFTSTLAQLQKQLDVNALFVRVVNRVSSLITNAKSVPGQYTAKYNSVQLLQYNDEGVLQDVTPAEQLSVPNSVLDDFKMVTQSNQDLIESDLAVLGNINVPLKTTKPLPDLSHSVDQLQSGNFATLYVGGFLLTFGKPSIITNVASYADVAPQVKLVFPDVAGGLYVECNGARYGVVGMSWGPAGYSALKLKASAGSSSTYNMIITSSTGFAPGDIIVGGTDCGKCIYTDLPNEAGYIGKVVTAFASNEDGAVFTIDGEFNVDTKRTWFLYGGNEGYMTSLAYMKIPAYGIEGKADLSAVLYPKQTIESLKGTV